MRNWARQNKDISDRQKQITGHLFTVQHILTYFIS